MPPGTRYIWEYWEVMVGQESKDREFWPFEGAIVNAWCIGVTER